jgi:hypothetical protein
MHVFPDKNGNKVLLLHIPKCAGTTLGVLLQNTAGHKWYNLNDGYYNDHMPINVAKQISDCDYSVCFVRNPYDRFLSKYSYLVDFDYHRGYSEYSIDYFLDNKPNFKDPGCWTPEGWRLQVEYINTTVNCVYKVEDENPVNVLNNILGTSFLPSIKNASYKNSYDLSKNQKQKIEKIYKQDFEELNY